MQKSGERAGSIGSSSLCYRAWGQPKTGLCAASSCKIWFDLYVLDADQGWVIPPFLAGGRSRAMRPWPTAVSV
jgi:hypothetical protein